MAQSIAHGMSTYCGSSSKVGELLSNKLPGFARAKAKLGKSQINKNQINLKQQYSNL
jgi:hypothetical protein